MRKANNINSTKMKAIVYTKYGPPEVLQLKEVDKPVAKDNEILLRVYATTVNRTDCAILRAKPFIMRFITGLLKPNKSIPGTEFAGEVEAVGAAVISFKPGDKVFAVVKDELLDVSLPAVQKNANGKFQPG